MEMEAEHAEIGDGVPGFADRLLALEGIDRTQLWMMRPAWRFSIAFT